MRLTKISAAALIAATLTTPLHASPLSWPNAEEPPQALAFHCAAVMTALGQAYDLANELLNRADAPSLGTLPDALVSAAGGRERMTDITELASGWRANWESVARTSFYPRLAGDGTPYLADAGRELMLAVQQCADRFDL